MERLKKAYVGVVENVGLSYSMQEIFNTEGYFAIRVMPLGAKLCLLEDRDEVEREALLEEGCDWLQQWFKKIRKWQPSDVDIERVTWVRCYGVPCHAWSPSFFELIMATLGKYMCSYDNTKNHTNMDVVQIMVRTKYISVLNETFNVQINEDVFQIKFVEDSQWPLRICLP
ncbi:unnamed protein product [Lathyrus oleraceus]